MNVLILNEQQDKLQNLEIDIIKSISGQYKAFELVEMFKNFYFNKMIIDVTAILEYENPSTYKTLVDGLSGEKIIFYLPEGSKLCTSGFLTRLINYGIFNFTTNIDGIKYLLNHTNTYKDVEHIKNLAEKEERYNNDIAAHAIEKKVTRVLDKTNGRSMVIGFRNITEHAGATSLIYMLKKELTAAYGPNVSAIEIDKQDFMSYNDQRMYNCTKLDYINKIQELKTNSAIVLVDLNEFSDESMCTTVINIIEPSTIKLNRLMRKNKSIIGSLKGKKVMLNMSLLSDKDIAEFELESGLNIMYNMPPLNDRKRNAAIVDFLNILNINLPGERKENSNKIFGLFRK